MDKLKGVFCESNLFVALGVPPKRGGTDATPFICPKGSRLLATWGNSLCCPAPSSLLTYEVSAVHPGQPERFIRFATLSDNSPSWRNSSPIPFIIRNAPRLDPGTQTYIQGGLGHIDANATRLLTH